MNVENSTDSVDFEENLRQRARELAPDVLNLIEQIARGEGLGQYRTRLRPSTQLSACRLLLQVAGVRGIEANGEDLNRLSNIDGDFDDHVDAKAFEKILWDHAPQIACVPRYLDTTEEDFDDMDDEEQEKAMSILQPLEVHLENPEALLNFFKMTRKQKVDLILCIARKIVGNRTAAEPQRKD